MDDEMWGWRQLYNEFSVKYPGFKEKDVRHQCLYHLMYMEFSQNDNIISGGDFRLFDSLASDATVTNVKAGRHGLDTSPKDIPCRYHNAKAYRPTA